MNESYSTYALSVWLGTDSTSLCSDEAVQHMRGANNTASNNTWQLKQDVRVQLPAAAGLSISLVGGEAIMILTTSIVPRIHDEDRPLS